MPSAFEPEALPAPSPLPPPRAAAALPQRPPSAPRTPAGTPPRGRGRGRGRGGPTRADSLIDYRGNVAMGAAAQRRSLAQGGRPPSSKGWK